MFNKEIYVIGDEDIVLMLGLLGIEGTIIENREDFLKVFNDLVTHPKIGMILITIRLSDEIIDFLLDFKLNNKEPFIFILPDVFQPNIERSDVLLSKISNAISDIELLK
jgi:vacuolar-type H+-ATPase subunit F/Vma7